MIFVVDNEEDIMKYLIMYGKFVDGDVASAGVLQANHHLIFVQSSNQ